MAGETFVFKLIGAEQLRRVFAAITPKLRRGIVAKALRAGGRVVRDATIPAIPQLAKPVYRKGVLIRTPGTLRASLKVRTSRDTNRTGDVGVFVNIRPAKGANRGKYNPTDPFYWRFVNFGTKKMPKRDFMSAGAKVLTTGALDAIEQSLAPELQQLDRPGGTT